MADTASCPISGHALLFGADVASRVPAAGRRNDNDGDSPWLLTELFRVFRYLVAPLAGRRPPGFGVPHEEHP
jgi:hypothetical protein